MVVTMDRPLSPGRSVPMFIVVECDGFSTTLSERMIIDFADDCPAQKTFCLSGNSSREP